MSIKTLVQINEASADLQAEVYFDKYRDQVDLYESSSIKARIKESISPYEIVALGQQLDQYQNYHKFVETQGNLGSLGNIPQIALDVITAAVGSSVIPLLASIQPMAEEHGIVYYKAIRAVQADGGYNAQDIITSPLQRDNLGDGTLGNNLRSIALVTTSTATSYTGTVNSNYLPLRPYLFSVTAATIGFGKDDGMGNILGVGLSGTINYVTGAWAITLAVAPTAGNAITAQIYIDVDSQTNIDKIAGSLLTKDIRAQIWALGADVGAFANFAFANRFGRSAIDEVAQDLTNELTRVMNTNAIQALLANVPSGSIINWDQTPSTGTSYAEHKLTFIDAVAAIESQIHLQSGASVVNRFVAGRIAAAVLRGMPDFVAAPDAAQVSVGLYGYYAGIPVIRATSIVPDGQIIGLSNSGNYFNAPMAFAPFMPLMVTNTIQSPTNPFRQTTAAGTWAGLVALNGNLSTVLNIQNTNATLAPL